MSQLYKEAHLFAVTFSKSGVMVYDNYDLLRAGGSECL